MNITYFDSELITEASVERNLKKLTPYRGEIADMVEALDWKRPEASLLAWSDDEALKAVYEVGKHFKKVKHVVLVGIGGSSLGTEAIHSVLATEQHPILHVLDTVSAFELDAVLGQLGKIKKAEQIAICVVSKSGTTTETLANASVLLDSLEDQLGKAIYKQSIFIGDPKSELLKVGKKLGSHTLAMPEIVGGRYSVFTTVGLMPLHLLGHDVEALLSGLQDTTDDLFEGAVAEGATRLYTYLQKGVRDVNFFAFDTRLVRLAKWYRQLTAESLGKEKDKDGKSVKLGFVPTFSTPVELHSTGQLYFSGFTGVYTDFLSFEDTENDFEVGKKTKIAPKLKGKSMQEIHTAIYGGVIGAYQKRELPYRATQLEDESLPYALGLFMGMRMLETMYLAHLMNVDAFNQPNVELYKDITRKILKV